MSTNVELKARYSDLENARAAALALGAKYLGAERQHDTYFKVETGRLKLRRRQVVSKTAESELIYYQRPDVTGTRTSNYQRVTVADGVALSELLTDALGKIAEVIKMRGVFIHDNVRIHLDDVIALGTFLEFEAVVDDTCSEAQATAKTQQLISQFKIEPDAIVAGSYADLIGSD